MSKEKVVMFSTPECGGCKILKPLILGRELPIELVDALEEEERYEKLGVKSVPAFALEDEDGNYIKTLAVGAQEGIKYINEFERFI